MIFAVAPVLAQSASSRGDAALERELRKRGLTELLERHMELTGGNDPISRHLERRELFLAAYRDTTRGTDDRLEQLRRATAELDALLAENPNHASTAIWQLERGTDLLFKQAEPHTNNILYRGGSKADREALADLAKRARRDFAPLAGLMEGLDERLDEMNESEFREFEKSGELDRLQQIVPRSEYFLRWADFYAILAGRDPASNAPPSLQDRKKLEEIAQFMTQTSSFTERQQSETGVQCQALLLTGMCYRLANQYSDALTMLTECVNVADGLVPSQQSPETQWARQIAELERVRVARDARKWQMAHDAAHSLMDRLSQQPSPDLPMLIAVAMLDRQVALAELQRLNAPASSEADRLRLAAADPIFMLADQNIEYESAIFGAVYATMDTEADPGRWDIIERLADLVVVVEEYAARDRLKNTTVTDDGVLRLKGLRAVQAADLILDNKSDLAEQAAPRTLYYLGLLQHLRGDELTAVDRFVELVNRYPDFDRAGLASDYALKIAAGLYESPVTRTAAGVRDAFINAARQFISRNPDSPQARYWRFYYAGALEEARQYNDAALEYLRIGSDHESYAESRYRHLWCLWKAYLEASSDGQGGSQLLPRRAFEIVEAARECVEDLTALAGKSDTQIDPAELTRWIASAQLIQAEMKLRPEVDRYQEAIDIVQDYETRFGDYDDLVVRALRIRLIAYQRLGNLDQALEVVSKYVERDPDNAGMFMQELLTSLREDVERMQAQNRDDDAQKRIAAALHLARQLDAWAEDRTDSLTPQNRTAVRLQLADACLLAGQYQEALDLFDRCLAGDTSGDATVTNATALYGKADALFHLERYDEANPIFVRLWRGLPQGSPLWWRAAARILACNLETDSDPQTLQRFVQQHRRIDPEFGGPANRAAFEALERRNRQRVSNGS